MLAIIVNPRRRPSPLAYLAPLEYERTWQLAAKVVLGPDRPRKRVNSIPDARTGHMRDA